MNIVELTEMRPGEEGIIHELAGGEGISSRLRAMGIRPGKKIKKVSSHFWRGPQTVEIDSFKLALGFGMASKVLVRVEE